MVDPVYAAEGITAVVAAMPEEVAALRAALDDRRCLRRQRPEIVTGRLGRTPIVLAVTGDGERNARRGTEALLSALPMPPNRLLVLGVSGALSPELETGELVVAERVACERGAVTLEPDSALVELAVRSADARRAVVVSAGRIADSVADKQRLLAAAHPGSAVAVVDLESLAYATVAQAAAIPWLILRAVSDSAHEGLPALLNRCRDHGGAVQRGRVLRELLGDPRPLPTLLGMRRRIARCGVLLAGAASRVTLAAAAQDAAKLTGANVAAICAQPTAAGV
jgi:adenosylhomocysteine nucleosidase